MTSPLNKESLQHFIDNYPKEYPSLTDTFWQQGYIEGVKSVLEDLKATFLESTNKGTVTLISGEQLKISVDYLHEFIKDNREFIQVQKFTRRGTYLDSYLEEDGILEEVIKKAKDNLENKYKERTNYES